MATSVNYEGSSYSVAAVGERSYAGAAKIDGLLIALAQNVLQHTGGSFTLSADVDWGNVAGHVLKYIKSSAGTIADAGFLRLNKTDTIKWRNNANSGNVTLDVSSDRLRWEGVNLVGISTTDTLTNKTMSGTNNTFSNIAYASLVLTGGIVNADINASAAIALNKLAAMTASRVPVADGSGFLTASSVTATELGYLSGVTSAIQTQLDAKASSASLSSHTGASTGVHGVTGAVVGTTDSQTLSAKTLASAVVDDGLDLIEESSFSSPSAGRRRFGLKSDGRLYLRDSSGNESQVGGSSAGGINYLADTSSNDAEASVGSWAAYADAAATSPVDGTGGSPNVTITRSTSSPLRGTGSFLLTKDGSNRQGEGCSCAFTIASADKAKPLTVSFEYEPSSSFVSGSDSAQGDIAVWVYDVTNSTLIPVSPNKLTGGNSLQWKFSGVFQTSSNSTSYRLIVHISGTTSAAWTLKFDNVSVGPQVQLYGSPITDWQTFTPTGSWTTNTTYTGRWRRVGDVMEVVGEIAFSGDTDNTALTLNLPSGYSIDTAKLTSTNAQKPLGSISIFDATDVTFGGTLWYSSTTAVAARYINNSDGAARGTYEATVTANSADPVNAYANGDRIQYKFAVPISGWGSNVVMSQDADTRVVAMRAYKAAQQTVNASTTSKIIFPTVDFDTHGAFDNATNYRFTAPIAGFYRVTANLYLVTNISSSFTTALYKNGSENIRLNTINISTTTNIISGAVTVKLNAGDYLEIFGSNGSGATNMVIDNASSYSFFNVERLSGPSAIAASETISLAYSNSAGTTLTKSANNAVPFATKEHDTHGAFATDTFTVPAAGKYRISSMVTIASGATWASGDYVLIEIWKNGSAVRSTQFQQTASHSTALSVQISSTLNLLPGDLIKINVDPHKAAAGNVTMQATASYCNLAIERVP